MPNQLASYMFLSTAGSLHDTRNSDWAERPLRQVYSTVFRTINTTEELRATLRAGPHHYGTGKLIFITEDGGTLAFETVRENYKEVSDSIRNNLNDGWKVVAVDDSDLFEDTVYDDHTNEILNPATWHTHNACDECATHIHNDTYESAYLNEVDVVVVDTSPLDNSKTMSYPRNQSLVATVENVLGVTGTLAHRPITILPVQSLCEFCNDDTVITTLIKINHIMDN